jgi:hypothetical protein
MSATKAQVRERQLAPEIESAASLVATGKRRLAEAWLRMQFKKCSWSQFCSRGGAEPPAGAKFTAIPKEMLSPALLPERLGLVEARMRLGCAIEQLRDLRLLIAHDEARGKRAVAVLFFGQAAPRPGQDIRA